MIAYLQHFANAHPAITGLYAAAAIMIAVMGCIFVGEEGDGFIRMRLALLGTLGAPLWPTVLALFGVGWLLWFIWCYFRFEYQNAMAAIERLRRRAPRPRREPPPDTGGPFRTDPRCKACGR